MTKINEKARPTYWWKSTGTASEKGAACHVYLQPGMQCPSCEGGTLGFNGLFVLVCDKCGKAASPGAFT